MIVTRSVKDGYPSECGPNGKLRKLLQSKKSDEGKDIYLIDSS